MEENQSVVDEILIEAIVKKVLDSQKPTNGLASYELKPEEREVRFKADAVALITRFYVEIAQPWQIENPYITKFKDVIRPLLIELL